MKLYNIVINNLKTRTKLHSAKVMKNNRKKLNNNKLNTLPQTKMIYLIYEKAMS